VNNLRSKRGAHWSASCYPAHANYQWHLDRMVEAKIGWVKFLSDGNAGPGQGDSGLGFGIDVLARGMVPVVRFYMNADHRWTDANDNAVMAYVAAGIRYIETINEPDLSLEWSDGKLPVDWAERSFTNWIGMAQRIIALGGIPLSPSLASGFMQARGEGAGQLQINPFELVAAAGIRDGEFVCSIHNYPLNHPINYPYDAVNQAGQPLTQAEYDRVGGAYAWDSQTLEQINAWRLSDQNPGDTVADDDSCFNAVMIFEDQLDAAGFTKTEILTTEGGPCLTDRHDRRYPRITPVVMQDMIADELDAIYADPRYLAYCWWLWGNPSVGGTGGWSTNQWFWPGGPFSESDGFIPIRRWLVERALLTDWSDTPEDETEEPEEPEEPDEPTLPETDLLNDASEYGVSVVPAAVDVGGRYWHCTRVHHLTQAENNGNHNVYVNVFREGIPARDVVVRLEWQNGSDMITLEKPWPAEPLGNCPLWKGQVVSVEVADTLPSDRVDGISTAHSDEPPGNTLYHHSFLVEWALATKTGESEPSEPSEPEEPVPTETLEMFIRRQTWDKVGVDYNPAAALTRYATAHGLGKPETQEFDRVYAGTTYRVQAFVGGIAFCVVGDWGNIQHIAW